MAEGIRLNQIRESLSMEAVRSSETSKALLHHITPPPKKASYLSICGLGISVGIATDYGPDGPGSNRCGDEIFRPSRPALEPTQPPVKWVTGSFPGVKRSRGVLLTTHPLLVPRSWKSRAIPLPTIWATPGL